MSRIKIRKHRGWYPRIKKAATLREQSGTYNNATRVDTQCQILQISREQLGTSGQYLSTVLVAVHTRNEGTSGPYRSVSLTGLACAS